MTDQHRYEDQDHRDAVENRRAGYEEGLDDAIAVVLNGCATAVATKGKMTCFACRQAADRITELKEPPTP